VFEGSFTIDIFQNFQECLVQQHAEQKTFLIVDRHAVHTSKRIERWLAEKKKEIEVFFLPAYSPELNPDELVNQDIKGNIFRKKRPGDREELKSMMRCFLRSKQRQPRKVQNYFKGKHVAYAKAA
jgi:transposase